MTATPPRLIRRATHPHEDRSRRGTDPPALGKHGGDRRSEAARKARDQGGAVTLKERGNARAYLLRRLARDHEDILERYERGEFGSVRAAAIEAGIVKRTWSAPVESEALRRGRKQQEMLEALFRAALTGNVSAQRGYLRRAGAGTART